MAAREDDSLSLLLNRSMGMAERLSRFASRPVLAEHISTILESEAAFSRSTALIAIRYW